MRIIIRYLFISFISNPQHKKNKIKQFQTQKKSSLNPKTQEEREREREREKGSGGREGLERNKRDSVPTNRFKWK
jgi:hypothetical protein